MLTSNETMDIIQVLGLTLVGSIVLDLGSHRSCRADQPPPKLASVDNCSSEHSGVTQSQVKPDQLAGYIGRHFALTPGAGRPRSRRRTPCQLLSAAARNQRGHAPNASIIIASGNYLVRFAIMIWRRTTPLQGLTGFRI